MKIITVIDENGRKTMYHKWEWNLAWTMMFILGTAFGVTWTLILS